MRAFCRTRLVEGSFTVDARRYDLNALLAILNAPAPRTPELNPVSFDLGAIHARHYGLPEPARSPSVPTSASELNAAHRKHYEL